VADEDVALLDEGLQDVLVDTIGVGFEEGAKDAGVVSI